MPFYFADRLNKEIQNIALIFFFNTHNSNPNIVISFLFNPCKAGICGDGFFLVGVNLTPSPFFMFQGELI